MRNAGSMRASRQGKLVNFPTSIFSLCHLVLQQSFDWKVRRHQSPTWKDLLVEKREDEDGNTVRLSHTKLHA